ncbi:hypothetical protein APS_1746 [Acetobacter pasteurianus subsp. pasteurianus LMG 1262 = NBRC 106471]|nr:hypothetical protein APS_1746 [Acetobacter pasteurianus subsp. pasteurianus LMG 1262 = NBRC 106471]
MLRWVSLWITGTTHVSHADDLPIPCINLGTLLNAFFMVLLTIPHHAWL